MHSPASNNDKDLYELRVTSEPSVGGGAHLIEVEQTLLGILRGRDYFQPF